MEIGAELAEENLSCFERKFVTGDVCGSTAVIQGNTLARHVFEPNIWCVKPNVLWLNTTSRIVGEIRYRSHFPPPRNHPHPRLLKAIRKGRGSFGVHAFGRRACHPPPYGTQVYNPMF